MYNRLPDLAASNAAAGVSAVSVTIDGHAFAARAGDTVAATLIGAGMADCRTTPVSGMARGPYCMMGVCFDCLVVIDGRPNQQGCMIAVAEGMRINRQQGARAVSTDDANANVAAAAVAAVSMADAHAAGAVADAGADAPEAP